MASRLIQRLRAHWILVSFAALLLAAYAAAGFFLLPHVARSQIERFVVEKLQRRVSLGEVRFNPFTLEANIADLRLTEADGAPLLSFRRLRVNAEIASLWRRGLVLKELELEGPDVEVIVAPDGTVSLARLAPAAPQDKPKADDRPLRVHIGRLEVRANLETPQPGRREPQAVQQPSVPLPEYLRGRRRAG